MYLKTPMTITGAVASLLCMQPAHGGALLLEDPFFAPFFGRQRLVWESQPGIAFYEKENKFYVEAPLPGVNEKDVTLTLDKAVLSIQGQRKVEQAKEGIKGCVSANSYAYQVQLPDTADVDHPEAFFKNGLMTIVFNKKEEAQPRQINFTF